VRNAVVSFGQRQAFLAERNAALAQAEGPGDPRQRLQDRHQRIRDAFGSFRR